MSSSRVSKGRSSRLWRGAGSVALGVALGAAALGGAAGVQACGAGSETSGRRVALATRLELEPSAASGFQTAAGWQVTLSKALLATGPFYYFDGAPPLVRLQRAPRARRHALLALGLGTAHAHPGHYQPGNALGQMLEPWSVDLLAGASDLPVGEGVTGSYRSARFSFAASATGPLAAELGGHAALVEGRAEKLGEPARIFRAVAELSDIERSAARGEVEGCEFSELDVEADGRVTVLVNPRIWFELVDFSQLEPGSMEQPAELSPSSQPGIAFALGLAQLTAYKFSYAADVSASEE